MSEKRSMYETELAAMPPGLDRAILRVLSQRIGRHKAIGRYDLVEACRHLGYPSTERQVREMVKQLRRKGHLICSAAGEDGGYYLAGSKAEYDEFRQIEFAGKINDMAETMKAMDQAAAQRFGGTLQPGLF